MKIVKLVIFAVIFASLLYLNGLIYIRAHETIHRNIYLREGIKSHIEINPKTLSGITIVEENATCSDVCKLQHGLNDIVGYSLVVIMFHFWLIFLAYILYKRIYKNEKIK